MDASRNTCSNPLSTAEADDFSKILGLQEEELFYQQVSECTAPPSTAETDDFSKILGPQEEELFYLQLPMRSRSSRDDINHCSNEDTNDSGFQICDNFEDAFEGRKRWGDYFDDGYPTDDSEISEGDPCNIDQYHVHFHHSQKLKTGTEDDEEH